MWWVGEKELQNYREDLAYRRTLGAEEWNTLNQHHNYRLSAIDAKTASLLQYNGIVVATLAILLTSERGDFNISTQLEVGLFLLSFVLSVFSIVTLLNSISLKWAIVRDQKGLEALHNGLSKATLARTKVYVCALWLSRIAGLALAALFLIVFARGELFSTMLGGLGA